MHPKSDFDIIIIGGGIGGLTLAIQSAKAGYHTAVFEKEKYPFHKVCGEYISNESKQFIISCGINIDGLNLPKIDQLCVSDMHGNIYQFPLSLGGIGISRFKIDHLLFQKATEAGVKIFTQKKVNEVAFEDDHFNIYQNDKVYSSKIVVAAYGKRSNIDLKMQRKFVLNKLPKSSNYIGIKYHVDIDRPSNKIELHNFKNGYCGISEIEDKKSCLCYLTTAENLSLNNNSIREMERSVLFRNPELKTIFTNARFLFKEPVAVSQISFERRAVIEDHILMVGDAAGLISPLCGNGMSMAMHSGKIALQNIDLFLRRKINRREMELNYANEWKSVFGKRMFVGRSVQKLFGNNFTTSRFLQLMNAVPALSNLLIRQTHGITF